jgi:hypothetical protein
MKRKRLESIAAARASVGRFAEIAELANRGYAVGITNEDRVKIVGGNPTMADITDAQVSALRAEVERREGARGTL